MGLGLVVAMSGGPAKAKVVPKTPVVVTISVHNDVAVPWGTIRGAEEEASLVFRQAGIDVEWLNCQAVSEVTVAAEKSEELRGGDLSGTLATADCEAVRWIVPEGHG